MKYVLNKIQLLYDSEIDDQKKTEIGFDLRLQQVNISLLEYQTTKLSKQIKYRIQEVWEWKKISDKLQEANNIENISYLQKQINTLKKNLDKTSTDDEQKQKSSNMIDNLVKLFS
jgi:hypothetical protein